MVRTLPATGAGARAFEQLRPLRVRMAIPARGELVAAVHLAASQPLPAVNRHETQMPCTLPSPTSSTRPSWGLVATSAIAAACWANSVVSGSGVLVKNTHIGWPSTDEGSCSRRFWDGWSLTLQLFGAMAANAAGRRGRPSPQSSGGALGRWKLVQEAGGASNCQQSIDTQCPVMPRLA